MSDADGKAKRDFLSSFIPAMPAIEMTFDSVDSPAPDDSGQLQVSLERESEGIWRQNRVTAVLTLTMPVWFSAAALIFVYIYGGMQLVRQLIVAVAASLVAGRFIIIGGESGTGPVGFSPFELALLVFCLDIIWAVVLCWHAGFLFHVPWLGERLKAAVHEGNQLLKANRWMRRVTIGVVLSVVMLPISSTGSIGGSLLGRLMGLSRNTTLFVVVLGSILGCGLMLAGAEVFNRWFDDSSYLVRYGGIAVIVLILFVLTKRYQQSIEDL